MIKTFSKYFSLLMIFMITCTFFVYKYKVYNFINSSSSHILVLDKNIENYEKQQLIKKLENLTFQNVNIEEKNDQIYVTIKCPPDKFSFFSKWILKQIKNKEKNE